MVTLNTPSHQNLLDALHQNEETVILYSTLINTKQARNHFTGNLTETIKAYFESVVALNILFGNFNYLLQVSFEKNHRSLGIRSFTDTKEDLIDFFCLVRDLLACEYTIQITVCITSPELKNLAKQYSISDTNTKEGRFFLKNRIRGINTIYKELWHSPSGHQLLYRTIKIRH